MTVTRSTKPSQSHTPSERPEALFLSVRAALAFAYSIAEFPIAPSPRLTPREPGSTNRMASLTAHEKHAQGALIRKRAEERLEGIELAVTFAYYGSGERQAAAIKVVASEVAKLIHNHRLGVELAKRYFLRKGSTRTHADIAQEFGKSRQTITRLDGMVRDEIDRLRIATESRLERLFVSTGIAAGV